MSWMVEGRRYHNHADYQRALAESEQRKAARAAEELARENRRLAELIAEDQRAMDAARDDLSRQMEIGRRVELNVQALQRNQQRLEDVAQRAERRMQEGLSQLERELQQQNSKLHGVEVDLGTLRENHRRQVDEMRRNLSVVRQEMNERLAEAEKRRLQTEERLKSSIQEVDRKVEADRDGRARRTKDQLDLARAECEDAAVVLAQIEPHAQALGLEADLQQIKGQMASGRTLIAQQNAASALAVLSLARTGADSLAHEAHIRQAELDSARHDFERRAAWIDDAIDANASADCKDCYEIEIKEVGITLSAARSRLQSRYRNHRLLQIERGEDEKLLDRLEEESLQMSASAAVIAEAAQQRMAQAEEALQALEKTYGTATQVERSFARAGDPKSDLLIATTFGSSKVNLRLSIDGTLRLDAYGHASEGECAAAAQGVLQELQSKMMIKSLKTDDHLRTTPLRDTAAGTQPAASNERVG